MQSEVLRAASSQDEEPTFGRPPAIHTIVFLNGIIGHALLVGLPIALLARWSAKGNKRVGSER